MCDPLIPTMDRGQSLIIPPLFDGTNYAYQKVHMRAFLQSLDEKVWFTIEVGWKKPEEPPTSWDDTKIKAANFNSRALNALFSAVTNEEFKKISSTDNAKEAWTIFQNTYEGTKAVKNSKLQRLTTSFKEIRMDEDESFNKFYAKLKCYITRQFKKFIKNENIKASDKDCKKALMRTFQYAQLVPSNKRGIIKDCPRSITTGVNGLHNKD